MSQILLIGRGPLPAEDCLVTGFSQRRTAHFKAALEHAGHDVRVALLVPEAEPSAPETWAGVIEVVEEGPGWLEQIQELGAGAALIVSAGPYNPGRAACLIAENRPVWADLPGDPFAELHALMAATEGGLAVERVAAAEAAALPLLARADAISVISEPQRHALMGELGAIGRLQPEAMPAIATIPIAMPTGRIQAPRTRAPSAPLVVALSGAFNPWFDDRTAAAGLDLAMQARPQLSVIVTGGGLSGFYEAGAARFADWAAGWPDRVSNHGWIAQGALPGILGEAHLGLSLDLPGPEPELGSRTRLLSFVAHGLMPIATPGCALAKEMLAQGELLSVESASPSDLARVLIAAVDAGDSAAAIQRAQDRLGQAYAGPEIAMPMVAWAANPTRAVPASLPAAALASQLAQERDALAQVHASTTWRTLSWLHRLVQRD